MAGLIEAPQFTLIQYPAIVKNVEKAIVSLGGLSKMSKDYFRGASLSLDYHAENVYSKSTIARKRQSTFVIIRVRRNRCPENTATTSTGGLKIEILGVASALHHFNVIFDFQFLPIKRVSENESQKSLEAPSDQAGAETAPQAADFECIMSKLYPQTVEESVAWFEEDNLRKVEQVGLFLPPVSFSKFFASTPYILCRETERKIPVPKNMPMGSRLRPQRISYAVLVRHQEANYPTKAPAEALKKVDLLNKDNPKLGELFTLAFDERPLWTRCALLYRTSSGESYLKDTIQCYGFYLLSGPWSRTWCKFGFDPRKDPEARRYQTITYCSKNAKFGLDAGETAGNRKKRVAEASSKCSAYSELSFTFKPDCLPLFRQMYYQLCDIQLPIVEEVLAQPPTKECHSLYGWITLEQINSIRSAIKAEVRKTAKETDRELVSSETDSEKND